VKLNFVVFSDEKKTLTARRDIKFLFGEGSVDIPSETRTDAVALRDLRRANLFRYGSGGGDFSARSGLSSSNLYEGAYMELSSKALHKQDRELGYPLFPGSAFIHNTKYDALDGRKLDRDHFGLAVNDPENMKRFHRANRYRFEVMRLWWKLFSNQQDQVRYAILKEGGIALDERRFGEAYPEGWADLYDDTRPRMVLAVIEKGLLGALHPGSIYPKYIEETDPNGNTLFKLDVVKDTDFTQIKGVEKDIVQPVQRVECHLWPLITPAKTSAWLSWTSEAQDVDGNFTSGIITKNKQTFTLLSELFGEKCEKITVDYDQLWESPTRELLNVVDDKMYIFEALMQIADDMIQSMPFWAHAYLCNDLVEKDSVAAANDTQTQLTTQIQNLRDVINLQTRIFEHGASGLKWQNVGTEKPDESGGTELTNPLLKSALTQKASFTQEEWHRFGIQGLLMQDFIKVETSYFKPNERKSLSIETIQTSEAEIYLKEVELAERIDSLKHIVDDAATASVTWAPYASNITSKRTSADASAPIALTWAQEQLQRCTISVYNAGERIYTSEIVKQVAPLNIEGDQFEEGSAFAADWFRQWFYEVYKGLNENGIGLVNQLVVMTNLIDNGNAVIKESPGTVQLQGHVARILSKRPNGDEQVDRYIYSLQTNFQDAVTGSTPVIVYLSGAHIWPLSYTSRWRYGDIVTYKLLEANDKVAVQTAAHNNKTWRGTGRDPLQWVLVERPYYAPPRDFSSKGWGEYTTNATPFKTAPMELQAKLQTVGKLVVAQHTTDAQLGEDNYMRFPLTTNSQGHGIIQPLKTAVPIPGPLRTMTTFRYSRGSAKYVKQAHHEGRLTLISNKSKETFDEEERETEKHTQMRQQAVLPKPLVTVSDAETTPAAMQKALQDLSP